MINKKRKIVIIILAVLQGVSLFALAGIFIYNRIIEKSPYSVVIQENIITPDPDSAGSNSDDTYNYEDKANTKRFVSTIITRTMYLYDRNSGDNTSFEVGNMFPGDKEIKYYCVKISYKNTINVRFRAEIGPDYEKLAEVMKCRVYLPSTEETLYDGLMSDMPESVNYTLNADANAIDELYYEITAYLDTTVGNEYMEQDLKANFQWWVEETENLVPFSNFIFHLILILWVCLIISLILVLILFTKERRK